MNELRAMIVNANLCRVIENVVDMNAAWNDWLDLIKEVKKSLFNLLDLIEQFISATIPRVKVKPNRTHTRGLTAKCVTLIT